MVILNVNMNKQRKIKAQRLINAITPATIRKLRRLLKINYELSKRRTEGNI